MENQQSPGGPNENGRKAHPPKTKDSSTIFAQWTKQPADSELMRTVHAEVNRQDELEACGYQSPSWRALKALMRVH